MNNDQETSCLWFFNKLVFIQQKGHIFPTDFQKHVDRNQGFIIIIVKTVTIERMSPEDTQGWP